MTGFDYVTDGSAIYRESFTIIRAESDLLQHFADTFLPDFSVNICNQL